jgi:hypothetical protein
MYDYPDGRLAQPVTASLTQAALPASAKASFTLGPNTYFWGLRVIANTDGAVVLWRPQSGSETDPTLTAATSHEVRLAKAGDTWESPMFPANQRPPRVFVLATAATAKVEVVQVVRQ